MRLHLASGNLHKAAEFAALARASGLGMEVVATPDLPPVVEDADTFEGNAWLKVRAGRGMPGHKDEWILADDSGLCVDALHGAPGVQSARYAGPEATDAANRERLLAAMHGIPDEARTGRFVCVLALAGPGGIERTFRGACEGTITRESRGESGFGYDPLFVPAGESRTFAELGPEEKNRRSHRTRAWAELADWLGRREPR